MKPKSRLSDKFQEKGNKLEQKSIILISGNRFKSLLYTLCGKMWFLIFFLSRNITVDCFLKMATSLIYSVLLVCCIFVAFCHAYPRFMHGRPRGGMLGAPKRRFSGPLPPDQWITQRLDHFDDANLQTWQQVSLQLTPSLFNLW